MIWDVDDTGSVTVVLETRRSGLTKSPHEMIHDYIQNVSVDLNRQGITLLSDEYRVRQYRGDRDRVSIIWKAKINQEHITLMREYLMKLAASHAGE